MSTIKQLQSEQFSVQGKVFDVVTKNGISNLLVTVYDVNNGADRRSARLDNLQNHSVRIGSVLSNDGGLFVFNYYLNDIINGEKRRPNLLVVISAPDDEKTGSEGKVIYYSNPPRWNAGRRENFNIGISKKTLKKFGIDAEIDIKKTVSSYKRERTNEIQLNEGVVEFHKASIEQEVEAKKLIREKLLETIATNPAVAIFNGEVVGENDSIKEKMDAVAAKGVNTANNQINASRGVPLNLYLTPEDRERLDPYFQNATNGIATIPEKEIREILFRTNSSENPGTLLVHQNPIAKFCAEETFEEKCAKVHTGLEEETEHHGEDPEEEEEEPGPVIEELTNEDIPKLMARIVSTMPSPDSVLTPEFNAQRATKDAIEESVDKFALRKGPAEVPAFYDFHSLQIAFEHVWKILIDEEIVTTTHSVEKKYKMKTGTSLFNTFNQNISNIVSVVGVFETISQEVPPEVAAQFDITLEEYNDLTAAHQTKLLEIARQISWGVRFLESVGGGFKLSVPIPRRDLEKFKQDLREQGDRMIDSIRHDDYYTLHKTLRDLHDRINSNYEFTVFAADKNFYSVNFGLMNTYRQQWTPINYQAGKLVKTIPLSPKEERKYSLKTTRNMKHTQKQARKNNSSLTSEQTSTTRAEAEIMEKAQNKTNFNLSTEGTYNIGISKGKATTSFGVEAQKESSENRKDIHESVVKAVQDYKEEVSFEINTEESSSSEYTESGTIVNPNDELSVTYLFYELQRRYRVFEQLYRVLPVVLVSQEVPAPHQITEAWVLSHDWIINRYLLDDSFRPALQYLANKSVGDDFALRELRKNLRQQRNLVETLRLELSIASDEAENRYRSLENAVNKRIEEESAENTDGWFSDVGDFFGGGGPDPEAAKARELAAKDAHQYAVEKAQKAALALRQEVNTLHLLTTEYNNALRNHLDNETRCKRLMVHIRNNIFYYMQAIWSMEPPDQRFLRLHKVQVPQLELATVPDPDNPGQTMPNRFYEVEVTPTEDIFENFREPGTKKHKALMTGTLKPITESKALVEIADLDNLLGFKGNYMIFPMKEHNALTEFMAVPYIDTAFGAMDPDELSNINLSDYGKYVCCLHEKLTEEEFDEIKPQLKKWLELLLADPLRNGDEIVIPTNSLFIESLPATYPLLENFKLRHRELDVYKVQADVRKLEMENLRFASRLLNAEREDPDIEKKIVVDGHAHPVIDVDN
jgi:hypothetical protein